MIWKKLMELVVVKHCFFWTPAHLALLWQKCWHRLKDLTFLGPHEALETPLGCFILGFRCHLKSFCCFMHLVFLVGQWYRVRCCG